MKTKHLGPVVRKVDSAIHLLNNRPQVKKILLMKFLHSRQFYTEFYTEILHTCLPASKQETIADGLVTMHKHFHLFSKTYWCKIDMANTFGVRCIKNLFVFA